jgi:glycosyltransferase involved in cell wall biosynthesis
MSAFDVFCLASHHEGLPIAMMEALALGLPVVATDVGGIPELVTDGVDGVLVPAKQPTVLADALVALLGDAPRRSRFSHRATKRAEELSVVDAVRRVESLYRQLVAS